MNLFELLKEKAKKFVRPKKPTPADFRRGHRNHRIVGYVPDPNSKHVGTFKGSITPMKRRFKGVSRKVGK